MPNWSKVLQISVFLFLGILIGWFSSSSSSKESELASFAEIRNQENYKFINPLLECNIENGVIFEELRPFKNEVQKLIGQKIKKGAATHISVYFRDLNNGPWFGINEREVFAAGSLLKVPLMIAAYRQEELTPGFLNKKISYKRPFDLPREYFQEIRAGKPIKLGESYTLNELVNRAIKYSDNDATILIYENLNNDFFKRAHSDLGVIFPTDETPEDYITVKNYASFFRILFNASYLSKDFSEKALSLLSETEFQNGLAAGVPRNIEIAHKFGERGIDDKKQLHDCGIVYYPRHPYLLCVMNRGKSLDTLAKNIADISKLVYDEIDKQFR